MEQAGQPKVLKVHNRVLIKRLIKEKGAITKPEIAKFTKLSLPTVNKIMDELVEEGYAIEASLQERSKAGRKARTYILNDKFGTFLSIYYMDEKWIGSIVDIAGNVLSEIESQALAGGKELETILSILDELEQLAERVMAIGIGVPGIVLKDGTIDGIPLLPRLEGVRLAEVINQKYKQPVYIENDVKLMTLGYYNLRLNSLDNIVFLYIGSGIGAGILINGQLYKGNCSFAGEFGYMVAAAEKKDVNDSEENVEKRLISLRKKIQKKDCAEQYKLQFCREIGRILINCSAVINPEAIVLYCDELDAGNLMQIETEIKRYLPKICVPKLCRTSDKRVGINGLIALCQEGIAQKSVLS
ncbi:MAG: ROK family transcriptional regulator [Lachnospiraceae bacterium]|nr:ROK family transcriptional regulator [Lachnospiraceae bacterium]